MQRDDHRGFDDITGTPPVCAPYAPCDAPRVCTPHPRRPRSFVIGLLDVSDTLCVTASGR